MMIERKVIEQRSCVSCRTVKHKSELIRCVRLQSGEVALDIEGKAQGRGAYLCKNAECASKAKKKKLLGRAFKTAVDEKIYDELINAIKE